MPRYPEKFSIKSRLAIVGSLSIALIALALILSNPTVQRNIVNAVGYSGTGGWTATGTLGGQTYNANWAPNPTGYDVSGTVGTQSFNYAVTGSYPAVGVGGGAPIGSINFFEGTTCPSGWEEVVEARGRYIVGMNSGGTLKAVVGTALSNQENRIVGRHSHSSSGLGFSGAAVSAHSHGVYRHAAGQSGGAQTRGAGSEDGGTLVSDNWATKIAGAHTPTGSITGSTANSGSITGTNAPYIQLLVCRNVSDTGGGSSGGTEGPVGPQGPPGPQGSTGSTGAQGSPGFMQLNMVRLQCNGGGCSSSANVMCASTFGSGWAGLSVACSFPVGNGKAISSFNSALSTICADSSNNDVVLTCYK